MFETRFWSFGCLEWLSDLRDEPEKQKPDDGEKNVFTHFERFDSEITRNEDFALDDIQGLCQCKVEDVSKMRTGSSPQSPKQEEIIESGYRSFVLARRKKQEAKRRVEGKPRSRKKPVVVDVDAKQTISASTITIPCTAASTMSRARSGSSLSQDRKRGGGTDGCTDKPTTIPAKNRFQQWSYSEGDEGMKSV